MPHKQLYTQEDIRSSAFLLNCWSFAIFIREKEKITLEKKGELCLEKLRDRFKLVFHLLISFE